MFFERMHGTKMFFPFCLCLVQRSQKNPEKGHIVRQCHPRGLSVVFFQILADTTVESMIDPVVFDFHFFHIGCDIAKHLCPPLLLLLTCVFRFV